MRLIICNINSIQRKGNKTHKKKKVEEARINMEQLQKNNNKKEDKNLKKMKMK